MPRIRVRCSIRVLMISVALAALLVWGVTEGRRLYRVSRYHKETAEELGEEIANQRSWLPEAQRYIDKTTELRDILAKQAEEPDGGGFARVVNLLVLRRKMKTCSAALADAIRRRDATLVLVEELTPIQRESERLSRRPWESVRLDPRERASQVKNAYFASVDSD